MAELHLKLLGGFQARLATGPPLDVATKKGKALLAYIALRSGQACSREKIAGLLWADMTDEQARNNLRQTLFSLRQSSASVLPPWLVSTGETVSFPPGMVDVDVVAFETFIADGRPGELQKACKLYHGDLLDGLATGEPPFDEWLTAERERLRALAIDGLTKVLAQQQRAGAATEAIQTALRALALDGLQEPVHRALMELYARQGRRGAALKQYQACVELLRGALGIDPELQTRELYRSILRRPEAPKARLASEEDDIEPANAAQAGLVGRQAELLVLQAALQAACESRGMVVTISGDAGIGKTRLTEEVARHAISLGGRALLGRCYQSEQILPFGPWVDAVRRARVLEDGQTLAVLDASWRAELARLFPEVLQKHAVSSSEPADARLFEAIARLFEALAARAPHVLILEDLHWADEMSLRLLSFIGRRVPRWRALVVGTLRADEVPEAAALRGAIGEVRTAGRLAEINLAALSPEETRALVGYLARSGADREFPASLADRVWAVSDGNPFMIVETVRAVQSGIHPATDRMPLPQRIRQLLVERLERLGEASRSLVSVAAVIGREFEFTLLQAASGLGERHAAEALEELVRRRVLRMGGERFQFVHDWIREVTDDLMLPPTRALLHRNVAEALERLHAADLEACYGALALHYDRGGVQLKAVSYLRLAARQSVARSAHAEAVKFLERALALLAGLPDSRSTAEQSIDVRHELRNSLVPLGRNAATVRLLREAESLATASADQRRLARTLGYMTEQLILLGDPEEAIRAGERALALAHECGDLSIKVTASRWLGRAYHVVGDYPRALERLGSLVAALTGDLLHERFDSPPIASVSARMALAWCLADVGEFAKALATAQEALGIAEAADHPISIIQGCVALGWVLLERGETDPATAVLERALSVTQTWNLAMFFPLSAAPLGAAHAAAGRVAQGITLLEQSVHAAESMGRVEGQSVRIALLADAYRRAGRRREALDLAQRALGLAREHKERAREARALRVLADVEAEEKHCGIAEAERHYAESLSLAQALGMRPLAAHCHFGLAGLMVRTRHPAQAAAHQAAARALYSEVGMPGSF